MTPEEIRLRVTNSKRAIIVEIGAFVVGTATIFFNIWFMVGDEPDPQLWLIAVGWIAVLVGITAFRARLRQWIEIADDIRVNSWSREAHSIMRESIAYAPRDARIRILESCFDKLGENES